MILEKWKQSDAYYIGSSHSSRGEICQDRTYSLINNGVHAIALADGAGSKEYSHLGSEFVTRKVCELLTENFYEYLLYCEKRGVSEEEYNNNNKKLSKMIIDELLKGLNKISVEKNISIFDLSSTLLFYAMKDNYYIQGHIGDGVIGLLINTNGTTDVKVASEPKNGDQPNITFFITDPDSYENLRIEGGTNHEVNGVILISDGTQELLYNGVIFHESTSKIFEKFNYVTPKEFREILTIFLKETASKVTDDDLSINILYKESLNTNDSISDEYINYFLDNVYSKEQFITISQYSFLIKEYIPIMKKDFQESKDVREYLLWT